jgi:hypothetical protein
VAHFTRIGARRLRRLRRRKRLIRCTVPGPTPNCFAITRTPGLPGSNWRAPEALGRTALGASAQIAGRYGARNTVGFFSLKRQSTRNQSLDNSTAGIGPSARGYTIVWHSGCVVGRSCPRLWNALRQSWTQRLRPCLRLVLLRTLLLGSNTRGQPALLAPPASDTAKFLRLRQGLRDSNRNRVWRR